MPTCAKDCGDVTDCSITSWERAFCICATGSPDSPSYDPEIYNCRLSGNDGPTPQIVDREAGIQGMWANSPGTIDAPGWTNPARLASDNNQYAEVFLAEFCSGSPYATLTDWGFNIPEQATIRSIVVCWKAFENPGSASGPGPAHDGTALWNQGLVLNGTTYWSFDPNVTDCDFEDPGLPPFVESEVLVGGAGLCSEDGASDFFGCDNTVPVVAPFGMFYENNNPVTACAEENGGDPDTPAGRASVYVFKSAFDPDSIDGYGQGGSGVITGLKQDWTPAEVNDPTFGYTVALSSISNSESGSQTDSIDAFAIGVYYVCPEDNPCPCAETPPPPPPTAMFLFAVSK